MYDRAVRIYNRDGTICFFSVFFLVAQQRLQQVFFNRAYSDAKYPKITTHYTVVPREKDLRWKGSWIILKLYISMYIDCVITERISIYRY